MSWGPQKPLIAIFICGLLGHREAQVLGGRTKEHVVCDRCGSYLYSGRIFNGQRLIRRR